MSVLSWRVTQCLLVGISGDESGFSSRQSCRELKEIVFSRDKTLLLEKCAMNADTRLISEIAKVVSWSKLWDCALDRGPRCISGLKSLVRIISYPSHATRLCPKCDANSLETSLLFHILMDHSNADFSQSDLLGALCEPDRVSDTSSTINSNLDWNSDFIDTFLNMVCALSSVFRVIH